jgi:hypothetical protein
MLRGRGLAQAGPLSRPTPEKRKALSQTIVRQPPEHPFDGLLPAWQGISRQMFTLVLVYAIGLGSMAMVGMLSPLTALVARDFSSGPAAIGWTISLFSLPAAITSTLGAGWSIGWGHAAC